MMFAFIGSASLYVATVALTAGGILPPNVVMAALANGFMLAIASASLSRFPCRPLQQPVTPYHEGVSCVEESLVAKLLC